MRNGTVKFYNRQKGFGFITRDDGTDDLFVSAASLTASGLKMLDVGQRVSFEIEKDPKGFRAANIKLESPPQPVAPQSAPAQPTAAGAPRATLYYDPSRESHRAVAASLQDSGDAVRMVDYAANPPARDELKRLSLLLGESGQGLVRRTDPMFFALQLDDRFLSENEFWTAIVEHPNLIDGPVLASGSKARLCKTAAEAEAFFRDKQDKPAKSVSPRILAMIQGHAVPPPEKAVAEKPVTEKPVTEKPVAVEAAAPKKAPEKPPVQKPAPRAKPAAKTAKPAAPKKPKPKPAPAKSVVKAKAKAKPAKRAKR